MVAKGEACREPVALARVNARRAVRDRAGNGGKRRLEGAQQIMQTSRSGDRDTHLGHRTAECVLLIGTRSAKGIMASGASRV
jgi:hypothetical protein